MKPNEPLFWVVILGLSSYLGYSYSTDLRLQSELDTLQKKVMALELQSVRQTRMSFVTLAPKTVSTFRDEVFKSLQALNDVKSPVDSKKEKRILLNDRQLKINDPEVAREDPFYDLLGTLMDEDLIDQIQIPQRAFYRTIRQELIRFGIPPESLVATPTQDFNIRLKKPI
jgi:hypothetical protein